jgi:hypothetical protein
MGLDTKTDWLTDRQSQCDFDFDLLVDRWQAVLYCNLEGKTWKRKAEESPLLTSFARKRLLTLQAWEDLACSDLWIVEISGGAVIACSSDWCVYKWSMDTINNSNPVYSHPMIL